MKTIRLQKLKMINFKGVRKLEINFAPETTNIFGANASGKTTIFDAFTWLLFGKDSSGRADFEVKTLDANNKVIEKLDHEVEAELLVNDTPLVLRRVLSEKWVKKRGSLESEFTGNSTEYYWNGVPMQQKEFQQNISEILDENIFKLITNPMGFNSLKWEERRKILTSMVDVSDDEIAGDNYKALLTEIRKHKSAEDYKKMVVASVKKAKDDIKAIPTRIDEVERNKPTVENWNEINAEIVKASNEIAEIDAQILDSSKLVEEKIKQKNEHLINVDSIKTRIKEIDNELKQKASESLQDEKNAISTKQNELNNLAETNKYHVTAKNQLIKDSESQEKEIFALNEELAKLRAEFDAESAKKFVLDPTKLCCPTCNRSLDDAQDKSASLEANFKADQKKTLDEINAKGKAKKEKVSALVESHKVLVARIEKAKEVIAEGEAKIAELTKELEVKFDDKKEDLIYQTLREKNTYLQSAIITLSGLEQVTFDLTDNNTGLLEENKKEINSRIDTWKELLAKKTQIEAADARIKELLAEEKQLAQVIADADKIIFDIENFTKAKIDATEGKINMKFTYVKFKMFEAQINGGEKETCEATINGVPFSDANTASKINAGVDIINTLTEYYKVKAPIFVDNKESVTNLVPVTSQLINLIVSGEDKTLRIV
jgi:exonuclease SbcC